METSDETTPRNFVNFDFKGKKAVVFGIANERSIAWGIAQALHRGGAKLAFSYQGPNLERRIRPLAERVGADLCEQCDMTSDADLDAYFAKVREKWDGVDILIHSVAFANRADLEGRFVQTSRDGFKHALDVSAYTLIAAAQRAEPLMEGRNGSIITITYAGSERVIPNYKVMGVAKAALEASVRYLAHDMGSKKVRVNAISAGPIKTLAASGIANFKDMLKKYEEMVPLHEAVDQEDVGELAAFLCSEGGRHITGQTLYVDSGAIIMGATSGL